MLILKQVEDYQRNRLAREKLDKHPDRNVLAQTIKLNLEPFLTYSVTKEYICPMDKLK